MKPEIRCKYCNAKFVKRTPPGALVRLWFSWLPLVHLSCEVCQRNFYLFDKKRVNPGKKIAHLLRERERSL